MELRHLRSFVTLAADLHFGRAARRLGISQPSLSQQLNRLESELGVTLLDRSSREVVLTAAGDITRDGALRTLAEADRLVDSLRAWSAGHVGHLVIGSLGAGMNGPLPSILRRMASSGPTASVELRHMPDSESLEQHLLDGRIDAAVLRLTPSSRRLAITTLLDDEPFVACMPATHALAGRDQIGLAELSDEPIVSWPQHMGAAFHEVIKAACRKQGFTLDIRALADSVEGQLALVAAGYGVSIQAGSNGSLLRDGVVTVPIRPEDISAQLFLTYRQRDRGVPLARFLDAANVQRTDL